MNNPYLTVEEINETFRGVILEENHNFLEDDLVKLANAFVMAAMPAIVRQERNLCIDFVNSLNTEVGKALQEKRGNL
jgi:predicted sugar kinase